MVSMAGKPEATTGVTHLTISAIQGYTLGMRGGVGRVRPPRNFGVYNQKRYIFKAFSIAATPPPISQRVSPGFWLTCISSPCKRKIGEL